MSLISWFRKMMSKSPRPASRREARRLRSRWSRFQPFLENLEDRLAPASYTWNSGAGTLLIDLGTNDQMTVAEAAGTRSFTLLGGGTFTQSGGTTATGDGTAAISFAAADNIGTSTTVNNAGDAAPSDESVTFLGGNLTSGTISVDLTQTAGTASTISFTTAATNFSTSVVSLTSPNSISEGMGATISTTTGSLTTASVTGTTLGNTNGITTFNATNTTSGDIDLTNTATTLTITGITETGGGNINVTNTGALSTSTSSISTAANGSISLMAVLGAETIGAAVSAGGSGTVTLSTTGANNDIALNAAVSTGATGQINVNAASGSILDSSGTGSLTANVVSLMAGGEVGQPGAAQIETTANKLSASAGNTSTQPAHGIWDGNSGALTVTSATTTNGVILINAAMTASGNLTATSITAGGSKNVRLQTIMGGDIQVGAITASGATVVLNSAGGITDADSATTTDLTALSLAMNAATSIGSNGSPLQTAVTNLAASSTGGGVFVTNTGAVAVAAVSAFGTTVTGITANNNLGLTAGGAITQTAIVTVGGTSSINAGANPITLALANAFTGAVSLSNSGANDVTLTNSGDLALGTSDIGRNLTVNAGGAIAQTGVLTVGGTSSFSAASNPITLTLANSFTGAVSVNNSGTNDVSLTSNGALALAASTVGRNLTVSAGGAITQTGILTVGGTSSFTAGASPITLTLSNAFTGAVSVSNSGTNDISVTNAGALALGTSSVGRNLTVTAGGAITQTGILTVGGTSSFSAGANPITLTLNNAFTGAVSVSNSGANDVAVTNGAALVMGASTVGRNLALTAGGAITQTGALTVSGSLTLSLTAAGSDVLLGSAANSIGGAVTFAGTLSDVRDVALRNVSAAAAAPTNLSSLTNLRNLTLTFDNAGIALPALTLHSSGSLSVTAGGAITQTGILTVPGSASFSAGANPITLPLANAFSGVVTVSNSGTNDVTLTNNGALILGASTVGKNLIVSTTGPISQTGILTVGGTSSFSAGANSITLNLNNAFTGAVSVSNSGTNDVFLTNAGALALGTSSVGRNLTVSAGGAITQTGILTVGGTSSFTAGANPITLTLANAFTGAVSVSNSGANDVSVTNAGALALGTSSVGQNLTVNAGGAITQTGILTVGGTSSFTAGANPITLTMANAFSGVVSVSNSGANDVSVTNAGALALGTSSVGRNLTVSAGGAITQTGILTVGGTSSFSAGANPITLTLANAFSGAVSVSNSGANDVSLTNAGALALGTSNVGRNLTVSAGGAITQTGILTVGGTSSFTAGANPITLTLANAFTGAVSVSNSGANDVSLTNAGALALGTSSVGRNLTVSAGGAITQTGILTVGGTSSFSAGANPITLTLANAFSGAVSVSNSGANDVSLTNAGALALGTSNVGRNLTVSAGGAITQTGILTVGGTSSFSAGANPITLTLANAFTGAVSVSNSGANDVSLTNAGALVLGTSSVGRNFIVSAGGAITQTGILTVGGTSSFSAGANPITLTLANAFSGPVSVTNSGTNDVSLTNAGALALGTSNVGRNLTVSAGGAISQTGILTVGGTSSFSAGANPITLTQANAFTGAVSVNNSGANDVSLANAGALALGTSNVGRNLTVSAGGAITQTGILTVGGTSSFSAGANPITLTMANAFTGAVSVTNSGANDVSLTNAGALVLGTSTVGRNLIVSAGGAITQTGILTVGGNSTFNTGANPITLTLANAFTGAVSVNNSGANDVSLTNAGALVLGTSNVGRNLTVNAGGAITQTGILTVGGTSSFSAGANPITLTLANAFTGAVSVNNSGANDVSLTNAGALVLGLSSVGRNLTVSAGGAITQTGILTVGGTSSFSAGANPITLTLANAFSGAVSVNNSGANDVSLTNAGALALGTSTVGRNFTVSAGGAITQTGILTVGGNSSFSAGANPITLTLANAFTGPVSLTNSGANDAALTNAGALNLGASTVGRNLTVNAGGTITVSGVVSSGGTIMMTASGATSDVLVQANVSNTSGQILLAAGRSITLNGGSLSTPGNVGLTATAGAISEVAGPATISAALLVTNSGAGTTLNNANTVTTFNATDSSSTGISLVNSASPLTITGITESSTGPVAVTNTGGITNTATISTTSGNITLLNLTGGDLIIGAPVTVTTAASTGSVFLKNTAAASPTEVRLNIAAPITAATTAPASVTAFVNGITNINATLTASPTGNPLTTTNINLYGGASSTSTDPTVQPDTSSSDTFNVILTGPNDGTSTHALNLNGRGGSDTYNLFLQDQLAGAALFNSVNLNDMGTGATDSDAATITGSNHDSNDTVVITQSSVAVQVNGSPVNQLVHYQGLDSLTYNTATQSAFGVTGTGNGNDTIAVQSTLSKTAQPSVSPQGTPVTISSLVNGVITGSGSDSVTVANAHQLNQIQAPVTFNAGKNKANNLFVDASANPSADSVVLTSTQISSLPGVFAPITYTGRLSQVSLTTGASNPSSFDVNVQSTSSQVSSTKVTTGPGNDFVLVSGADQTLSHLGGGLAVDEGAGSNKLVFSDAAFAGSDQLTLTSAALQSTSNRFVPVSYTATGGSFARDVVLFSGSVESVNVQSDRADSTTFVSTGNGGNSITVSSNAAANGTLAGIAGTLVVQSGSGRNTLFVSDSGNTAASGPTNLTNNSVQVTGVGTILYGTSGSYNVVEAELGQGNDVVSVQSTLAAARQTVLVTGAGNDLVVVSSSGNINGSLNGIQGALDLDEGGGVNKLVASDAASSAMDLIVLTSTLLFSNSARFAQIGYTASGGSFAGDIAIYTGSVETVNVQSDLAGATTFISTGNGGNTVIVSSSPFATGTVAGIVAPLVIQTGSGVNGLVVSDSGNAGPSGGTTVNNNNIAINGQAPILYGTSGSFSSVAVELGQGNDLVNVQSTLAAAQHTIVLTGAGNDTFSVSSTPNGTNGVLTGIQGELDLNAGGGTNNQLIVSEAGYTHNDTVNFTSNAITSSAGTFAPILYVGTFMPSNSPPAEMADDAGNFSPNPAVGPPPGILIRTGLGNDTFTLSSMSSSSSVYADTGPGNDFITVYVSNTSNYKGLTIDGGNVTAGSGFQTGLNQLVVTDVSGGGVASISSANGSGGGSKLHPFTASNLGLITVSYPNGSTSVIAVADFTNITP